VKIVLLITLILSTLLYARNNPFKEASEDSFLIEDDNKVSLLNINSPSPTKVEKIDINKSIEKKTTIQKIIKPIKANPINIKSSKVKIIDDIPTINNAHEKSINEPIVITDENIKYILDCCKKKVKKSVKHKKFHKIPSNRYKTIYKNYFLTIKTDSKRLKIITTDRILCKKISKDRKKLILDFKRVEYFKSFEKNLNHKFIKSINIGSHHCYYRIVIHLKKRANIKVSKRSYGYIVY